MVTNLNSNYLKGYAVGDNASGNNGTVGFIPRVASDGVMEVGKYIDFHDANNNNVDYNTRLMSNAGALLINGNSIITSAGGTVNGNFSINKQTPALNIFGGTDDQTIINFWDDGSIISSIINDNSLGAFIFKSNNDFLFNDGLNVNQMTINSSGVDINKMSIHSTAKVVNLQADSVDGFHFWKGSLTAYNAITTKDANTMYIII